MEMSYTLDVCCRDFYIQCPVSTIYLSSISRQYPMSTAHVQLVHPPSDSLLPMSSQYPICTAHVQSEYHISYPGPVSYITHDISCQCPVKISLPMFSQNTISPTHVPLIHHSPMPRSSQNTASAAHVISDSHPFCMPYLRSYGVVLIIWHLTCVYLLIPKEKPQAKSAYIYMMTMFTFLSNPIHSNSPFIIFEGLQGFFVICHLTYPFDLEGRATCQICLQIQDTHTHIPI